MNFTCPQDGFFRDEKDCRLFYECVHRTPNALWCPQGYAFDTLTEICDHAYNVPNCSSGVVLDLGSEDSSLPTFDLDIKTAAADIDNAKNESDSSPVGFENNLSNAVVSITQNLAASNLPVESETNSTRNITHTSKQHVNESTGNELTEKDFEDKLEISNSTGQVKGNIYATELPFAIDHAQPTPKGKGKLHMMLEVFVIFFCHIRAKL